MNLSPLTAVSPIDGRYYNQTKHLSSYFSEFALIRYRLIVEVEYFIMLSEKKFFKADTRLKNKLRQLADQFTIEDAMLIKDTEAITNHDVGNDLGHACCCDKSRKGVQLKHVQQCLQN